VSWCLRDHGLINFRTGLSSPLRCVVRSCWINPRPNRAHSACCPLKLRVADVWFRRWVSEFEVDGLADMPAKQKACLSRFVFLVTFEFIPVWSGVPSDC
jgi:hypothetical protein